MTTRLDDLARFYALMDSLRVRCSGCQQLSECTGTMNWPHRGLYFFFEPGETRSTVLEPRVVRVGTHALTSTSKTTLWQRLSQHRGTLRPRGGNHRGSIFRLHVGEALLRSDRSPAPVARSWGKGSSAPREVTLAEQPLEEAVSISIGAMPFLWLAAENQLDGSHQRGYLERNAIGLLSNYGDEPALDPPSPDWLGQHCSREAIRRSGLWNVNHVADRYDPAFLDTLQAAIELM